MTISTNTKTVFASYIAGECLGTYESQEEAYQVAFNSKSNSGLVGVVDEWKPGTLEAYNGTVYGVIDSETVPLFDFDEVNWAF